MNSVTPEAFKRGLGHFGSGVTVITITHDGKPYGVTVSSFASVSLTPPLVLFSLAKEGKLYPLFVESEYLYVNILAEDQRSLSHQFSLSDSKSWKNVDFENTPLGPPKLIGCIATLGCSKKALYDGGDHTIFLLKVETIETREELAPLLHYRGKYGSFDPESTNASGVVK